MATIDKIKVQIKKTGKTVFDGGKKALGQIKKGVDYTKQRYQQKKTEKEIIKRIAVDEYFSKISKILNEMESIEGKNLINSVLSSSDRIDSKEASRIKRKFPIPIEQIVLYSKTSTSNNNRISGLVLTNKGVFIKTEIKFSEEFAIKKENRKISDLVYCPWEMFEPTDFVCAESAINEIEPCKAEDFINACKDLINKNREIEHNATRMYGYVNNYSNQAIAASGVFSLRTKEILTRNNGVGNNPNTGHGIFAEHANTMIDRIHFKPARVVGGDNLKDGPDRLVNGVRFQTKYYKTAAKSVNAAFDGDEGLYRYYNPDGTPMRLEVPRDQYAKAIETMQNKIKDGKVPGVTDINEAKTLIKKGHITYEQARNIARPGTIESLIFDVGTGAVISTCVFGISFLINTYISYRKTKNLKEAFLDGVIAGGEAAGLTLGTHIAISQLSRTTVFKTFFSKSIIGFTAASSVASFCIFSIPATIRFARNKISKCEYAANLTVLSASIIGSAVGSVVGRVAAGTAGSFVGGIIGGTGLAIGTAKLTQMFYEGDDAVISRLFNAMTVTLINEYLLSEDEIKKLTENIGMISDQRFKQLFGDIHSSKNQENTIRNFLIPMYEKIVEERETYIDNSEDTMCMLLCE